MSQMKHLIDDLNDKKRSVNHRSDYHYSPCLIAALNYAAKGLAVFPVNGKKPFKGSHGYKDATTDPEIIKGMFKNRPHAGVAIATGAISGVFVVDVDPRNGGNETFRKLVKSDKEPDTCRIITGGGGKHYFFKYIDGIKYASSLGDGVDIKSDGGYVVAAPSIHPTSGERYRWDSDSQKIDFLADVNLENLKIERN